MITFFAQAVEEIQFVNASLTILRVHFRELKNIISLFKMRGVNNNCLVLTPIHQAIFYFKRSLQKPKNGEIYRSLSQPVNNGALPKLTIFVKIIADRTEIEFLTGPLICAIEFL